MRFVVRPVMIAACVLAGLSSAHAQIESREGIALQNQIYQLRAQLQVLQEQSGRGGPSRPPTYLPQPQQPQYAGPSSDLLPQLLTRVDSLEDQVRQLRGRVDELQNQVQQQNADLSKRIDDLAFQMGPQGSPQGSPQGRQPPAPPAAPPGVVAPAPSPTPAPTPSANRTPEASLQEGRVALSRHD
ncbi:MAG TPA: hypothetical protein VE690_21280, partial [Rhodopila sp.]|nr:hypothetical protein [Rhodopila sp.]